MASGVWQNAPGLVIIALAIAGIGALPYGVHRLYYGEPRKVGRDRWDFEMDKRDTRLLEMKKLKEKIAKENQSQQAEVEHHQQTDHSGH
jgi:hypothetical protein